MKANSPRSRTMKIDDTPSGLPKVNRAQPVVKAIPRPPTAAEKAAAKAREEALEAVKKKPGEPGKVKRIAGKGTPGGGEEGQPELTRWQRYWQIVGGGSLVLSLSIHVVLLAVAAIVVGSVVSDEKAVDFLPGGGSKAGAEASNALAQKMQTKKRTALQRPVPIKRVVSTHTSAIALAELPPEPIDMPTLSSVMGGLSGSAGFGTSGAAGGFGAGMGIGGMKGQTFKPVVMFGKDLKARRIGVILDVSGSMTPYLTAVLTELDRVAAGSRVMLYVGCGVATPQLGMRLDRTAIRTTSRSFDEDRNFETFWRRSHGEAAPPTPAPRTGLLPNRMAPRTPVPEEAVYNVMAKRQETYFMQAQGIQYAWIALLVRELRDADALYWFSDFQDQVDDKQLAAVLENLKRNRQKLFIHPSAKGSSFAKIRDQVVIPSGGEVIEPSS